MPIEPMLTEETPANALVARVLEEAGIEMCLWHLRRPYRPYRVGPRQCAELGPHGHWCARNRWPGSWPRSMAG